MAERKRFSVLRTGWRLLLLSLFAAGWCLAAAALHVVVVPGDAPEAGESTEEAGWKVLVLPKDRLGFRDTYVDTRPWSAQDIADHQPLVSRLIEAGHGERITHLLRPEQLRQLEQLLESRRSALVDQE